MWQTKSYYLAIGALDGLSESEQAQLVNLYNLGYEIATAGSLSVDSVNGQKPFAVAYIVPIIRRVYDQIRIHCVEPEYFKFVLKIMTAKMPDFVYQIDKCKPLLELMRLAMSHVDCEAHLCSLLSEEISQELLINCAIFHQPPTTQIVYNPSYKEWINNKKTQN